MNKVLNEGIKNIKRYEEKEVLTKEQLKEAMNEILKKIDENLDVFTHQFPMPASVNNVYPPQDNTWGWTTGFWTGMLWLAYEVTGDEKYKKVAKLHTQSFTDRIDKEEGLDHHDLGFLYSLSCVADYKVTGSELAKESALKAANHLMKRYKEKGQFIQAWGELGDTSAYRLIIDCYINLPLLYWATEVTGDKKYYTVAYNHAKTALDVVVREDASTFHTYYFNYETGEPLRGATAQGYSDDSCWARGQAWGVLGFPLTYKYTKDESFLEMYEKVTNYFLNRLPEDDVAYWDLVFTSGEEPRDSSSAAIAICGMLECNKYLKKSNPMKEIYSNATNKILKSLIDNYSTKDVPESNGMLLHAVYGKPGNNGVDECNIWGDYYYMEALVRLVKDWNMYW